MRISNARLADGRLVDVSVVDGLITEVADHGASAPDPSERDAEVGVDVDGDVDCDLDGWLLLPAPAEPHAHLDKALTAAFVPNPTGDLAGAIEAWVTAAQAGVFTHDDMVERVCAALDRLLLSGVTAVRSHINCGSGSGITHLVAAQEAVARYRGLMHVEFVALTHSPMSGPGSEENQAALRAAIEAGIDVVGGCPHLEDDGVGAIAVALDAAVDAGLPIDLHIDETLDPSVMTLRDLTHAVVDRGVDTGVTASHCVSLGMQAPEVQTAVAREVADAHVSIVALPHTNLFLQGRDRKVGTPRGLTAVHVLREAGAVVAAGADNVQDPFNPVGRSDPLETAALMVMAGHVLPDDAYEMVSNDVRRVMRLPVIRFEAGDPAEFLAIDATSVRHALADAPVARKVFHRGRLVASSSSDHHVHRTDQPIF